MKTPMRASSSSVLRVVNLLAALLLPALLLLPSTAGAVTTTGRITGAVVDPTGLPVEGAEVTLSGPNLIGGPRTVRTSPEGEYRFIDLPPGIYVVEVKSEGFRDTRQENIQVAVGQTTQVDVVLEPPVATTAEAYVVTAAPSTVDTERTQLGTTINQRFTSRVYTSRDYQGIALMAPGVHNFAGGSSSDNNASGNPIIHGANPYSNQYLLDGINTTDPVTNTFSRNFNFDAIEDTEVLTGGRDAEYGGATGGVINIVTKSGGNEFTADGSIYVSPDTSELARRGIVSGDSPFIPEGLGPYRRGELPRRQSSMELNLNLGGPIIKDKLWFFTSNQVTYTQGSIDESKFPGVGAHPAREFRGYYGLLKLTYQAKPWQRFQLMMQGDPTSISNDTQSPTVHPDAERHQNQGGGLVVLSGDTTVGERVLLKNKLGLFSSYIQVFPESGDFETPSVTNTTTGTTIGNSQSLYRDTRNRIQYSPQLVVTWDRLLGTHEFKLGMDAMFAWNRVYDATPGGRYYLDTGIPADLTQRGTPDREVRLVEAQNAAINGDTIGLYVQDVWKPFRTLTIRPGLRFDSSRMRNDRAGDVRTLIADPRNADGVAGYVQDQADALGNVFDATIIHLNALSPRIGFAWDPLATGRTNLHGGYYRYTDTSYLLFPSAVGRSTRYRQYEYNPATGRYDIPGREEGGESGFLVKPELSGYNPKRSPRLEDVDLSTPWEPSIQGWDPLQVVTGHHVPKTDELVLGASQELAEGLSVSLDGIARYISNLYEDDETNIIWDEKGEQVVGYRNGKPQVVYSLGTPDAAYQIYYGFDFNLRKRLTDRFEGMISYAFSVNRGTTNTPFSVAFDREKQFDKLFGYVEFDRRHVLRILGYYHFPLGFIVGGNFSYLSGLPYNKFKQNPFFGDYADLAAPRGYDPDNPGKELRMPDIVDTNLRLMWDAEELTGLRLWLITDVSNVLNLRTPLELEERDLPAGSATQWGDVLNTQAPIQFTFGLRFQH
ncbi:MAG: carboxypeptidase regulatory-like domain-containing protein [Myxococcota bacterium]